MRSKALFIFIIIALCFIINTVLFINCNGSEQNKKNLLFLEEQKKINSATTVVNNGSNTLPLKNLKKRKIACINIDSGFSAAFTKTLEKYAHIKAFNIPAEGFRLSKHRKLSRKLRGYNTIILLTTGRPLSDPGLVNFISKNRKRKTLILCAAGNYNITGQQDKLQIPSVITETGSAQAVSFCAQLIFGGVPISPEAVSENIWAADDRGNKNPPVRLKYTVPEEAGIDSTDLLPIDGLVDEAIKGKMTPGAVIMIVKDGKVIMEKSYGHHTYKCRTPVRTTDLYDLASITKAAATTIAMMSLVENKKVRLESRISSYLPETRRTNKKNITVKDLMLHRAGLIPFIKFSKKIKKNDFRRKYSRTYSVKVAKNYYLKRKYYKKKMWPQVLKSPARKKGNYLYSDLSMFFIKEIIEKKSRRSYETFLYNSFYTPLGMHAAFFNPIGKVSRKRIVPTEIDRHFRKTTIRGYVHDQAAAMMGGVAGHAGLFSSEMTLLFFSRCC